MRIALDTNVLAYAEGVNGAIMRNRALALIQRVPPGPIVLPAQTLGELFNVIEARRRQSRVSLFQSRSLREQIPLGAIPCLALFDYPALQGGSIHAIHSTAGDNLENGRKRRLRQSDCPFLLSLYHEQMCSVIGARSLQV